MQERKLYGSHYVLAKLPIWATVAIFMCILMPVLIGRDIFEGLMYNVAYSSMVGDVGLMVVILIAATVLKRDGVYIPKLLQSPLVHLIILELSFLVGVVVSALTIGSRSGQKMDIYHDVIIAPLILYLAITLLPVIFKNGKRVEKIATICFILLWLALVGFDIKFDRMDQRTWLQNHGVTLKGEVKK